MYISDIYYPINWFLTPTAIDKTFSWEMQLSIKLVIEDSEWWWYDLMG